MGALTQEVTRNSKADALKRPEVVRGQALFQQNCAACHGVPRKTVSFEKDMSPSDPQLWE